ncbi:hypothetical protein K438DRAFT_1782782 [Mycena galopus ATCC 62051]|nr:hypothetical protein K438DRAFT_1782782 [Mycena galopus ATCC 62051]
MVPEPLWREEDMSGLYHDASEAHRSDETSSTGAATVPDGEAGDENEEEDTGHIQTEGRRKGSGYGGRWQGGVGEKSKTQMQAISPILAGNYEGCHIQWAKKVEEVRTKTSCIIEAERQRQFSVEIQESRQTIYLIASSLARRTPVRRRVSGSVTGNIFYDSIKETENGRKKSHKISEGLKVQICPQISEAY